MLNQWVYDLAVWLDTHAWSTMLHESYYMYNWIETTHVLTLMVSLGMLFLIDLRMLGYALPGVPATRLAERLNMPMLIGFSVMFLTGMLLFYAIPVRSAQSVWFRIKFLLLIAAAINAFLFHRGLKAAGDRWDNDGQAPASLRRGAILSLLFWMLVVICGRLIAYDWFDCSHGQSGWVAVAAGCLDGQAQF